MFLKCFDFFEIFYLTGSFAIKWTAEFIGAIAAVVVTVANVAGFDAVLVETLKLVCFFLAGGEAVVLNVGKLQIFRAAQVKASANFVVTFITNSRVTNILQCVCKC